MIVRGRDIGMDIIMNLAKIPYYGTHEERNITVVRRSYDR